MPSIDNKEERVGRFATMIVANPESPDSAFGEWELDWDDDRLSVVWQRLHIQLGSEGVNEARDGDPWQCTLHCTAELLTIYLLCNYHQRITIHLVMRPQDVSKKNATATTSSRRRPV